MIAVEIAGSRRDDLIGEFVAKPSDLLLLVGQTEVHVRRPLPDG